MLDHGGPPPPFQMGRNWLTVCKLSFKEHNTCSRPQVVEKYTLSQSLIAAVTTGMIDSWGTSRIPQDCSKALIAIEALTFAEAAFFFALQECLLTLTPSMETL